MRKPLTFVSKQGHLQTRALEFTGQVTENTTGLFCLSCYRILWYYSLLQGLTVKKNQTEDEAFSGGELKENEGDNNN